MGLSCEGLGKHVIFLKPWRHAEINDSVINIWRHWCYLMLTGVGVMLRKTKLSEL